MIRPEGPRDRDAVRDVHIRAFGQPNEADLVDALRPGAVSLVAVNEGRVVGHIFFSEIRVGGAPALALAPMGVLPEFQRKGIGSELVRRGLEACGERLVIVLGHPEFYPRFGFVPARPLGIEPPWNVRDEVWMARGPVTKGRAAYPPAFDGV